MARMIGVDGSNITQISISTINCKVFDLREGGAAIAEPAIVVNDVVFNTLQGVGGTGIWTKDVTGYNFRHDMPSTSFPNGDTHYRVEYEFVPTTGQRFWLVFDATTIAVLSV